MTREMKTTLKRIGVGKDSASLSVGALLSLAFPDRIGRRRPGDAPRFLMSGGKGAVLPDSSDLAASDWLAIVELDGDAREAKIRRAAALSEAEITQLHSFDEITLCRWDKRINAVISERQMRLGSIVVASEPGGSDRDAIDRAMLDGIRSMGLDVLGWSKSNRQLQTRAIWVLQTGADLPDMSTDALLGDLEDWLLPFLGGAASKSQLGQIDLTSALKSRIGWDNLDVLDQLAPLRVQAATGTGVAIDYSGEQPKISVRLQEMMGVTTHPTVGQNRTKLLIELLSPAGRPIQTTSDLPGFWATSYKDVRKDMRGRYPKHHWPEDPSVAEPTRRVKHPKK